MFILSHCFNRKGECKKRKMGMGGESDREAERQGKRRRERKMRGRW